MTGMAGVTRTAYPSRAHEFIPGFCSICMFLHSVCTSLCVFLSSGQCIVSSSSINDSDYHVDIFKLYFQCHMLWFLRSLFVVLILMKVLTITV
jgi:hypothetical protein